ncbi:hypothetical protein ACJMK2_010795 [Sinanodonta woodiana]|uniref:Uncharacterized protein n=1 Tax=Sinanodonta woodiana TaxID=1069815 RepID=A0ABD3VGK4_SINWO
MATANHNGKDDKDEKKDDNESNVCEKLTPEEGREFEEFRKSMGIVGNFTKQMVKLAIDQLRPEFEKMAGTAAERALESKMAKVKELQDDLNQKEKDLQQLKMEKKILQAKFEKEKANNAKAQQSAGSLDQKDKEIKRLESDIASMKGKLRKKAGELKKERERASIEEQKRIDVQTNLQSEIDRLKKELDKVKGNLGQLRSAKNVSDEETKKLRDRERLLTLEIDGLKQQQQAQGKRTRKHTR